MGLGLVFVLVICLFWPGWDLRNGVRISLSSTHLKPGCFVLSLVGFLDRCVSLDRQFRGQLWYILTEVVFSF